LGVFAHGGLAVGLVVVSLMPGAQVDLMGILLGDILAVGKADLVVIWAGAGLVAGLLAWRWSGLLTATLNADLAQASGIDARREELILTLALAVVVAVALKVVGALLISAMLIVPAATVRPLARSPEAMAVLAAACGALAAMGGIAVSFLADTPTGPTIVALATGFFLTVTVLVRRV
jgi:zinc transport system permease protein